MTTHTIREKAKKTIAKVWALDDAEAVPINGEKIMCLTRALIEAVARSPHAKELARLRFEHEERRIFIMNRRVVAGFPRSLIHDLRKELTCFGVLAYLTVSPQDFDEYLACVIDIFTKRPFLSAISWHFSRRRQQHGLRFGVIRHLWSVSLTAFFLTRAHMLARALARAGLYHDIALHESQHYLTDFEHPRKSAEVARACGEPESICRAVEEHLAFGLLRRGWRRQRSPTGRRLMFFDSLVALSERGMSVGIKVKELTRRRRAKKLFHALFSFTDTKK